MQTQTLKLTQLVADPEQPRQEFDANEMMTLEKSIKEMNILNPIIVEKTSAKGKFLIIDGERRFRAATKIGLKEVPVRIVNTQSPTARMIMRFHLQDQHKSWSIFDKARAIVFFKESEDLTTFETAELLGVSKSTVDRWCDILKLSKRSQEFIVKRRIPFSYANKIRLITDYYRRVEGLDPAKVEEKLLNKYNDGVLTNNDDFADLIRISREKKTKDTLIQFLEIPNMTVANILGLTKLGKSIELDKLIYRVNSLRRKCNEISESKESKKLTTYQRHSLEELIEAIESLL